MLARYLNISYVVQCTLCALWLWLVGRAIIIATHCCIVLRAWGILTLEDLRLMDKWVKHTLWSYSLHLARWVEHSLALMLAERDDSQTQSIWGDAAEPFETSLCIHIVPNCVPVQVLSHRAISNVVVESANVYPALVVIACVVSIDGTEGTTFDAPVQLLDDVHGHALLFPSWALNTWTSWARVQSVW